jgi:hypothetical protein
LVQAFLKKWWVELYTGEHKSVLNTNPLFYNARSWKPKGQSTKNNPAVYSSTHHFFRNACTKSGSLWFSQFSGWWLILSVYIIMSFYFPFVRLFGVW